MSSDIYCMQLSCTKPSHATATGGQQRSSIVPTITYQNVEKGGLVIISMPLQDERQGSGTPDVSGRYTTYLKYVC
ncbi:hypothetical protein ACRALDRAFT_1065250 [Sodiomyces alcalophilus JCM 7366]|uniref:uncharacterized protein n=1 Tax=Sodiomyces alcalophilus JCM 7366 TaxID=591952 RepID=UPI0039B6E02B